MSLWDERASSSGMQGEKSEVATSEVGRTHASHNVLGESPWKEKDQRSTHEMGEMQMMVIF